MTLASASAAGLVLMEGTAWSVVLGGVFGVLTGLAVPALIARVPEPVSEPEATAEQDLEPDRSTPIKPTYVDISRRPALGAASSAAAGLCGALIGWRLDLGWELTAWLLFLPLGIALAIIDAKTKLLPSYLIKPAYVVLVPVIYLPLVVAQDWETVKRTTLAWLVYGGIFFLMWFIYPRGLGYGDVRLAGLLALLLGLVGWAELIVSFYATFLLGPILMLVLNGFSIRGKQMPFGPFMVLGALIGLTFGRWVLSTWLV